MHEDRRLFPRYSFTRPAAVRGPDGALLEARSRDISAVGISLLMARDAVAALAQGGSILTIGDRFQLLLPSTLGSSLEGDLTLKCRATYVRRLSLVEYQVGARFLDPTAGQKTRIALLVESASRR